MKYILSLIISGALVVSGFGQTRNVLVNTNNAVVQPTNFWSADASNARTNLGLGWSALTNTDATNFRNAIGLGTTNSVTFGLINIDNENELVLRSTGIYFGTNIIFEIDGQTFYFPINFNNSTNVAISRTNLGLPWSGLTNTNAENFRNALGLGVDAFVTFSELITRHGTNPSDVSLAVDPTEVAFGVPIVFAFTNATQNAAISRTNLGLGWSALTNTDATNFRNAIGLGTTNDVVFNAIIGGISTNNFIQLDNGEFSGLWSFLSAVAFDEPAETRTNLGLPWSGLTNTNAATFQAALFGANTNPVLVDTNGEVVSPTNFWQAAPITTTFIESQPSTNSTTNITAARFLHIHSLNTNIVNVTNTIALPTNGSTYNGDVALIVHQGPTNSMTRVRSVGSTNDIATMTRYNEAIEFVYYNNTWTFNHNEAFTEPIYFAGTNAAGHAAESRTNLGLGNISTNTYQTTNTAVFINTNLVVTNSAASFVNIGSDYIESTYFQVGDGTNGIVFETPAVRDITLTNLGFGIDGTNQFGASLIKAKGTNGLVISDNVNDRAIITFPADIDPVVLDAAYWNHAAVRTSLGLGTTNNVSFSNVTTSGTLTATGTVTATTNLVVNGFVDFSTNHTNVAPATNNQVQKWLQIRIGTNAYFLPLYQ